MRLPAFLRRPSRLALRIYAAALLQFLVVAGAMELSRQTTRMPPFGEKQARYVAQDLARVWSDEPALQREAQRIANTLVWTIDVRNADGALRAQTTRTARMSRSCSRSG